LNVYIHQNSLLLLSLHIFYSKKAVNIATAFYIMTWYTYCSVLPSYSTCPTSLSVTILPKLKPLWVRSIGKVYLFSCMSTRPFLLNIFSFIYIYFHQKTPYRQQEKHNGILCPLPLIIL
jgi:hypothetical protein